MFSGRPRRELVAVCLTNRVYFGRDNANEFGKFRVQLHQVIAEFVLVNQTTDKRADK